MKKRIFSAVLVLLIVMSLILTGCGSNNNVDTGETKPAIDMSKNVVFKLENTDTKEVFSVNSSFDRDSKDSSASAHLSIPAGHYNVSVSSSDTVNGGEIQYAACTFDCPKSDSKSGLTDVHVGFKASSNELVVETE